MRWSETLIPTLKEVPSDAEVPSHRLMLRAGLIRKLSAGTYSYLSLGLKVLKKVEAIIRQEMDGAGAQEVFLPAIQPAELWRESGRYEELGDDMVKFRDRHGREMVLGPTHEEVITDLVKREVASYRQLPLILYQIQTKFRDELRPRSGVIRSCEFVMKDAYSFDRDESGLDRSYQKMYDAYCRIFDRCGVAYKVVAADPGVMGGWVSQEFMVLSDSGEDDVVHCPSCGYAAGPAMAECQKVKSKRLKIKVKMKQLKEVPTPGVTTIEKVGKLLKAPPTKMVKTLIYLADAKPVAALVRGDHEANETKLGRLLGCSKLALADGATIERVTGAPIGYSGPVGLEGIKLIADYSVPEIPNFITGANKRDAHLMNVNLDRDFKVDLVGDIRYIASGEPCPRCGQRIKIQHAIEVGHIFKLGLRYSKVQGAKFLDEKGKEHHMVMGCYGIGLNRIIAASIELDHDDHGIIWPITISPFEVLILLVNPSDHRLKGLADEIYQEMKEKGIDVLLDDRDERAGVKFKDADLIGIPLRVVVGAKGLEAGRIEIETRKTHKVIGVKKAELLREVQKNLDRLKKTL